MTKTIDAIYENGVLRPLIAVPLREHEKVRITLETARSVAQATSGMIRGLNDEIIDESAMSSDYLPEEA